MSKTNKNTGLLKRINGTKASLIAAAGLITFIGATPWWSPTFNDWAHGPGFHDRLTGATSDETATTAQEFNERAPTPQDIAIETEQAVQEALETGTETPPILSTKVASEVHATPESQLPTITAERLANQGIEDLRLTDEGIYYHDWDIEDEGYLEIERTAEASGIPLHFLLAVFAKESSLEKGAINNVRASGYGQLMPVTMAELSFQFAETVGFTGADNFIERVNIAENGADPVYRYPYANSISQHAMINASFDSAFNTRISAVNMIRDLGGMQRTLSEHAPEDMDYYPVQAVHGYAAVFAGGGGGRQLLKDMVTNNGNSEVREFFSATARNSKINQRLLYFTKIEQETDPETGEVTDKVVTDFDRPKTVAQFYSDISKHLGDVSTLVLPDFRNSREAINNFGENLKLAGVEPIEIEPLFAPMFPDVRPVSREQGLAGILARANKDQNEETARGQSGAVTTSLRPVARRTNGPTPNQS